MKKDIAKITINKKMTIRETMSVINNATRCGFPPGIALLIENKKLIGVVTDGDIRRAILRDVNIESSIENIVSSEPVTVKDTLNNDEMLDTIFMKVKMLRKKRDNLRDYKVDKVVILNEQNEVVDVIDFYELWVRQDIKVKKVCVFGTGFVGLTISALFAEAGHEVVGVDLNEEIVEKLSKGEVSFYEKGLQSLVSINLQTGNLHFVSSMENLSADVYIVCVGTPIDELANKPIYEYIVKVVEDIGSILKKNDLVILRSTISVGTTKNKVLPILEKMSGLKGGRDFNLSFAPERVVEGNSLVESKEIPQIIGGLTKTCTELTAKLFQRINPLSIVLDSLEESEMVKLLNNSYRDLSFAYSNQIAQLCCNLNIDTTKVIKAANEGYPRNPIPMPSPGVGGSCLTKDPYILADVANKANISSSLFTKGREINKSMCNFVIKKVFKFLDNNYDKNDKIKIYILGFAFKGEPETSDIRNSVTIDLLNKLQQKVSYNIDIYGFDNVVDPIIFESLSVDFSGLNDGFKDAHCVLIMNNHHNFEKMDIFTLSKLMAKPGMIFDGWSMFYPSEFKNMNHLVYESLGGGY